MSLVHLTVNIAIAVAMARKINRVIEAHERLFGNSSYGTFIVFISINIILNTVTALLAGYNFTWNIFIMHKNMTLNEYTSIKELKQTKRRSGDHVNEEGCCHAPPPAELLKLKTLIY